MTTNLTGQKFGRWTVSRRGTSKVYRKSSFDYWVCRCACGSVRSVAGTSLLQGKSLSCGCYRDERVSVSSYKHGYSSTKVYKTWQRMLLRCKYPEVWDNRHYAGRGIKVCKRWHKFEHFLSDMGIPTARQSIDRVDVNGNYCRSNCRWADARTQANNQRKNVFIEYSGTRKTIAQWATALGFRYLTLYSRLQRNWPVAKALTRPVKN